jgi:hypothetical protein
MLRHFWFIPFLLMLPTGAHAGQEEGSPIEVVFAGLSITGACSGKNATAPVLAQFLCSPESVPPYNERLRTKIESLAPQWVRLASRGTQLTSTGTTGQVFVTATVDRESTSVEKIGDNYKVITEIAAQALFFDYESKKVLGSVPVNIEYIDVRQTAPDEAARAQALLDLLDAPGDHGLIPALAEAIATARPSGGGKPMMQLSEITYSDAVLADYPTVERKLESGVVGLEFSKYFSAGTGLALLPFLFNGEKGAALERAVALNFANASTTLKIPTPDYAIRVNIDRAAQRTAAKDAVAEQRLYGVFFTISIIEPEFEKTYFRQPLKHGAFKTIPSTQTDVDDAAALYATMLEGFATFARATQGKADNWVSEQPGGRSSRGEWSELRKKIEECR